MSGHQWSEAAAAYALGALDPGERTAFEGHLEGCLECQRAVDSYREVTAALADGAPRLTPPSPLRERVAERVRIDGTVPDVASYRPDPPPPLRAERSRLRFVLVGTAAASLLLATVMTVMLQRTREANESLARALADSEASLAARDTTIADQRALLDALLAPELSTASLVASAPQEPGVQLFMNRASQVLVVAAFNLPPAPPGRIYQLWGINADEAPVSIGLFDVAPDEGPIRITPAVAETFDVAAVTEEPASGSPQPTSAPFLVGNWHHGD